MPFRTLVTILLAVAAPLSAQSMKLSWSSIINSGLYEAARASVVDKDGNIWVAGSSSSSPELFPGPNDPFQAAPRGKTDIFLAKYQPLADGGTRVLYWTWIGGSGNDEVKSMKIDTRGWIVLTGSTDSTDFPLAGKAVQDNLSGATDAFIAMVDPTVSGSQSLVYGSYYGGTQADTPMDLAIAPDGSAVIVGVTRSSDLPKVSGFVQDNNRGGWDAFVIRINPLADTALQYASYFGGRSTDAATSVAIDRNGLVWMAGYSASDDFPVTSDGYKQSLSASFDAFLVTLDLNRGGLDALRYGTFYGGDGSDAAMGLAFDATGQLWMAGQTASLDLPVTAGAAQNENGGAIDAFLVRFDPARTPAQSVQYASYFGGSGYELVSGLTLLPGGRFALTGYTMFGGLPTAGTPYQPVPASAFADSFVSILNGGVAGPAALEYSTYFGGSLNDVAAAISSDASGAVIVTGASESYDLRATDGSRRTNPPASASGFVLKLARP